MLIKYHLNLVFRDFIILVALGSFSWIPLSHAGSDSSLINFSATFVGGSCEVTTTRSQIIFNGGEAILPSDIRSSPPEEEFDLILTNCNGFGLRPLISIDGESTVLYGPALFRDSTSMTTSDGYGILLSTVGNHTFSLNGNLAENKMLYSKDSSMISLNSIDSLIPITAKLTCGNCDYRYHKAGDLTSTVTFNFIYD